MSFTVTNEEKCFSVQRFITCSQPVLHFIETGISEITAVSTKVVPQKRESVRDDAHWYYV